MLWKYDKRNLNLLEYILYNTIASIIYWVMFSFIFSIQDYILEEFNNIPGLDLLISLCPILTLYWFTEVSFAKLSINSLGNYSKRVSLITFIVTLIILVMFFGFLKISL